MTLHDYIAMAWHAFNPWMLSMGLVFALFCYVLLRLDNAPDTTFKFSDFFTAGDWDGKASVARLAYFGAFLSHSLVLLHREIKSENGVDYAMGSLYALIWSGSYVALKTIERVTQSKPQSQPQGTSQ